MSTNGRPLKALLVEDSDDDAFLVMTTVERAGLSVEWTRVDDEASLRRELGGDHWDVILCDYGLPQFDAPSAIRVIRETNLIVPIIIVSGTVGEEIAIAALKLGANDYLLKDKLSRLPSAIEREIRESEERKAKMRAETAQQDAESALLAATTRFDLVLRAANDPVWDWSQPTDSLWFNDRFYEIYGYPTAPPPEGLKFWFDRVHPEDVAQTKADFRRFVAHGGETLTLHYRFRRADETYAFVLDRCFAVRNEAGHAIRAVGSMVDITEQKLAAEELTRIKTAIEFASDAIAVVGHDGQSIFHNRTFTKLLGFTPAELNKVGGIRAVFAHHPVADTALEAAAKSGSWSGNAYLRTRNGDTVELFLRANAARHGDGNAWSIVMVGTDIGEERKAQRKIAEQAALLDQAQDAILVKDLHGHVTYWNKGAERMFGWSAPEVLGRCVQDFLYPGREIFEAASQTVLKEGKWNGELTKLTKEGRNVLILSHWTLLRDDFGDPKSILAINTDITERKQLEAQFFRAQRMESIGTLAGGIAHDLNNVLGPIIMAVDLFKLKMSDPSDLELLETVEVSARRGAEMVKQVLSFARGIEGHRTIVQPAHLLREIGKIAKETFPKSIAVIANPAEDLWNVPGDPTQLHQVLLNLTVNARDAMPNGGRLQITARNMEIDDHFAAMNDDATPGPYVVLQVSDDGMGMSPDVIEKIFEPFFTTKEIGQGTGLGLSTTVSIVRSHNGFITVDSQVGRGTTFRVYIPADSEDVAADSSEPADEAPRGSGETILVIDDEASVRAITKQTLETFGYRVITACDGAEGIAAYARNMNEIAAILTDMMMPVMDGAATIRALIRLNPEAKIIAASGLSTKGAEADSASAGAVRRFLPKPYTASTMLHAFYEVLHPVPVAEPQSPFRFHEME